MNNPIESQSFAQENRSGETPSRPRFLIVDDDRLCRELLKDMLSQYADCEFAFNGQEAIQMFSDALEADNRYDLICLDIMMPKVDGHAALSAMRGLETERGIFGSDATKVVMVTALRESSHCVQSFIEGCEAYVTKPIKKNELFEKLRLLGVLEESLVSGE